MTRLSRCREIWEEFCETSTFHGLPHTVLSSAKWMQIVWMLLVTVGTLATLVPVALYINRYEKKVIGTEDRVSFLYIYQS